MSPTIWTAPALWSEARPWRGNIWRMVEAQHIAATMKLVDSRAEQDLLESLLETSKPPLAAGTEKLDYLLATPFRYPTRQGGSRFRAAHDPGVFYGAENVTTACAELGYWRWRFLCDADGLQHLPPVAHTAFSVALHTTAIDLRQAPFAKDAALWQAPQDYRATQALAQQARQTDLGAIQYTSVRASTALDAPPNAAWCMAVLRPQAFAKRKPNAGSTQTWWLQVRRDEVTWRRDDAALSFKYL